VASSCAPTFDSCVQVVKGGRGRCFEKTTGRERGVLEVGGEDSATVEMIIPFLLIKMS
jgi:hypothetical protein